MTLPVDESRCLDTGCPEHLRCARFLDRPAGTGPRTPYIATCWQQTGEVAYPGFIPAQPSEGARS